jgi:hypothetical protein
MAEIDKIEIARESCPLTVVLTSGLAISTAKSASSSSSSRLWRV